MIFEIELSKDFNLEFEMLKGRQPRAISKLLSLTDEVAEQHYHIFATTQ
jgi:hypothetical protein